MNNLIIFSSSRSEYYILEAILDELYKRRVDFKIYNYTFNKKNSYFSEKFNFRIIRQNLTKIKLIKSNFNKIIQSTYKKINKYKYAIIYGDRVEAYLFAQACFLKNIEIIHIGGGDLTYGSLDNKYRYLITLMSSYHFVTNNLSYDNIKKLTKSKNIYDFGYMFPKFPKNNSEESKKHYKIISDKNFFLITFHPNTVEGKLATIKEANNLLIALEKYSKNFNLIFTYPNTDMYNEIIIKKIKLFQKKYKNIKIFENLGKFYPLYLKHANLVIGNSSSGVYEAPFYNKISINIGSRQEGRQFAESVISVEGNFKKISTAINNGLRLNLNKKINKFYKKSNTVKVTNKIVKIIHEN